METVLQNPGFDNYLKADEAAEYVGVSARTLRSWGRAGKLNSLRHPIHGYRVYRQEELEAILQIKGLRMRKEKAQILLSAIVQSSEDAIITKNLSGRILSWNPAAERIFGYTANEAIGQSITMIIPRDRMDEEDMIIEHLRRRERINHFETVRITKSGELIDIALTISPLHDSRGNVIGASKIARDITLEKRLRNALNQSEQRFREYSAKQVEGLMYLNGLASKLAHTYDARSMLEAILSTILPLYQADQSMLSLYHPETGTLQAGAYRGLDEKFLERLSGSGACDATLQQKRRIVVEDTETDPLFDSVRHVAREYGFRAVHSMPIITREEKCIGVLSVYFPHPRRPTKLEMQFMDICVRQAADFIERINAEEMIKEADRRKDEFLATLAHELRNPLAPIKNALHILEAPQAREEIKQEARHMMQRQVHQMQRLIDDLMDVARVSRGKIELKKQYITINEVIQNAIEIARPLITAKKQNLAITLPPETITLDGDVVRLSQIFANLLNNAAKYMNKEGVITLAAHKQGTEVVVSIKDNGIGIPAYMLPSVFDMFVQVDNALERAQGGLGIGLTLVKELVALHGGRVIAYSEGTGKGSEFIVYLPIVKEKQSAQEEQRVPEPIHSCRVLVVDDNDASARTLGWTLELSGHNVMLAHDLQTTLDTVKSFRPDVILLDIGMPGTNGYDICRLLRQNPHTHNTFIIAQTGWGQQEHRKRSQEAGFDYHLVKPIDIIALQRILSSRSLKL